MNFTRERDTLKAGRVVASEMFDETSSIGSFAKRSRSHVYDRIITGWFVSVQAPSRTRGAARARASAYSSEWARLVDQESAA